MFTTKLASQTGACQMRSEALERTGGHRSRKNPASTVGQRWLHSLLVSDQKTLLLDHAFYCIYDVWLYFWFAQWRPLRFHFVLKIEQLVLIHDYKTDSAVLKTACGKLSIRENLTANVFCKLLGFVVTLLFSCQCSAVSCFAFCPSGLQVHFINIVLQLSKRCSNVALQKIRAALAGICFSVYKRIWQMDTKTIVILCKVIIHL